MEAPYIDNNKRSQICGREVVIIEGASDNRIVCVEDTTRASTLFKERHIFLTDKKVLEMKEFCKQKKLHVLQCTLCAYNKDEFAIAVVYGRQKSKFSSTIGI